MVKIEIMFRITNSVGNRLSILNCISNFLSDVYYSSWKMYHVIEKSTYCTVQKSFLQKLKVLVCI